MYLYNFPQQRSISTYESAINKIVELYAKQESVVSIYQMGGVTDPGISDIDLIIVFKENISNSIKPLDVLNTAEKYLFTHTVFGISDLHFKEGLRYNIHHNYKLLWGEEITSNHELTKNQKEFIEKQIALEFILSNLIARTIEKKYRLLSVRNILLSVKALLYDLNYLKNCANFDLLSIVKNNVEELIIMRKTWFENKIDKITFLNWYIEFYDNLAKISPILFLNNKIEYYGKDKFSYGKNVIINFSENYRVQANGTSVPPKFIAIYKKIRNANKYCTHFRFLIPAKETDYNLQIERYLFYKKLILYNKQYIRNTLPLINSYFFNYFKYV